MKLKLIDFLQTELEIPQSTFANRLKETVDEGNSSFLDMFSSKKEYRGYVNSDGFKIKPKRKFFDSNISMAQASGVFIQKDKLLFINTEINGFNNLMIPYYIFCIIIYTSIVFAILSAEKINGNAQEFVFPFILFHSLFMLGMPYIMMRKSITKLKHELEREFFYLTKERI
ncbi:MAG: hypothetical protein CMO01_10580 [Thalassobius sp.]|nr:hypothetical protein [Thalassovita sp.]